MDDRLRETLSAMMDDQADELSVRRLLSHVGQDEIRSQWQRWQGIRDLMHEGNISVESVDVSEQVRQTLEGGIQERHSADDVVPVSAAPKSPWHWPAVAMVALSLVIGFGVGAGWEFGSGSGALNASTADSSFTAAENEALAKGDDRAEPVEEIALQGLDEEQWEHLSRYLLEHAQHNSVGAGRGSVGYARVANASGPAY